MDEAEVAKQVSPELEQIAAVRARDRARTARWDLDITVFLFGILAIAGLAIILGGAAGGYLLSTRRKATA